MSQRDAYGKRNRGGWEPTDRQRAVLDLLMEGKSNAEIAARLGMTLDGAKWHVSELLAEVGVEDRRTLASWWREETLRRRSPMPMGVAWPPLAFGMVSLASLILIALVASTMFGPGDSGPEAPWIGQEAPRFPDVSSQQQSGAAPTETPEDVACPMAEGDMRIVDSAELSGEGLVFLGSSFLVNACPLFVANRDDRAFVRVPLHTEVSVTGTVWAELLIPWHSDQKYVEVAGHTIVVRASHNVSYEGPGMEVVLQAWNAGGSAFRVAVDSEGGLWASPEPSPQEAAFEHWTGELIETSGAEVVGPLLGSDSPSLEEWAKPVFYFTSCFDDKCRVSVRPGEPLVAPIGGMVHCITGQEAQVDYADRPIGEIELDTGTYKLRFVELYTSESNSGGDKSCPTREVGRGDRIGNHYHYAVLAFAPDGEPLSVAVSQDGTLYVGDFHANAKCPCTTGH